MRQTWHTGVCQSQLVTWKPSPQHGFFSSLRRIGFNDLRDFLAPEKVPWRFRSGGDKKRVNTKVKCQDECSTPQRKLSESSSCCTWKTQLGVWCPKQFFFAKKKNPGSLQDESPPTKKVCAWPEDLYDPKAGISRGGEGFPPKRRGLRFFGPLKLGPFLLAPIFLVPSFCWPVFFCGLEHFLELISSLRVGDLQDQMLQDTLKELMTSISCISKQELLQTGNGYISHHGNHGNLGKSSSQKCRLKKGGNVSGYVPFQGVTPRVFFAMNEKHLAQKTCYDLRWISGSDKLGAPGSLSFSTLDRLLGEAPKMLAGWKLMKRTEEGKK